MGLSAYLGSRGPDGARSARAAAAVRTAAAGGRPAAGRGDGGARPRPGAGAAARGAVLPRRSPPARRRRLANDLVKISAYAAECVRDDWYQSERRLGQRPLVVRSQRSRWPTAQADQRPGADFVPGAAQKIAQVTRSTLDAIAFPTFVAELIRGTFDAITQASVKQMEAYGRLLGNVGRSVDDFMNQNISDNQARDWLVENYPHHLRVRAQRRRRAAPQRPGAKQREGARARAAATRRWRPC